MHKGKYVFSQVVSTISKYEFNKSVNKYNGNYRAKEFKCWHQFLCMLFGQLTHREGIRDIINCLSAHQSKLYHLGIKQVVSHSTLSRANESRDWRIWANFSNHLIQVARPLYLQDNDFTLKIIRKKVRPRARARVHARARQFKKYFISYADERLQNHPRR